MKPEPLKPQPLTLDQLIFALQEIRDQQQHGNIPTEVMDVLFKTTDILNRPLGHIVLTRA